MEMEKNFQLVNARKYGKDAIKDTYDRIISLDAQTLQQHNLIRLGSHYTISCTWRIAYFLHGQGAAIKLTDDDNNPTFVIEGFSKRQIESAKSTLDILLENLHLPKIKPAK